MIRQTVPVDLVRLRWNLDNLGFSVSVSTRAGREVLEVGHKETGTIAVIDPDRRTVRAVRGFHLAQILRIAERHGYGWEYDPNKKIGDTIDFYDRVWLYADWDARPEENEDVLVELENGECVWCTYKNNAFLTCGSALVGKGIEVTPFRWAWTEE
jgi:hypothetical protein